MVSATEADTAHFKCSKDPPLKLRQNCHTHLTEGGHRSGDPTSSCLLQQTLPAKAQQQQSCLPSAVKPMLYSPMRSQFLASKSTQSFTTQSISGQVGFSRLFRRAGQAGEKLWGSFADQFGHASGKKAKFRSRATSSPSSTCDSLLPFFLGLMQVQNDLQKGFVAGQESRTGW